MDTTNNISSLILASLALSSCISEQGNIKNVLFIMVDDMRPSIGCYGDPYAITPNIDLLSKDADVYTKAYCQQALSGPSRASILTGLRPDENGVTELNTWIRSKHPDIVTLPQIFRENGYHTSSIGKIFHGPRNAQDSLSWSQPPVLFKQEKSQSYILEHNKTGSKAASHEFTSGNDDLYCDIIIRNEALIRLEELSRKQKPFFLAVGFLKPHLPFNAPDRFMKLYEDVCFGDIDTNRIKNAPETAYHDSNELRGYTDIRNREFSKDLNTTLMKAYYACTSFADENIGALINQLKKLGLYKNTVIVVLGDHGYHTGEQGLWCKSTNYEAACHAPLLIKDAGKKRGRKINTPVEFIDIFPTLAKMCGIEVPTHLSGKDLNRLDDKKDYYSFSQFPRPYDALHNVSKRTHMGYTVRSERWRYTEWYDNDGNVTDKELYDLGDNMLEEINLSGCEKYRNTEEKLRSILSESLTKDN